MAEVTPRVTAPYLEQFTHNIVRITGVVKQLLGEKAVVDSNGQITVFLDRDAHLQMNHAVELIGKVQQDLSVKVLTSTDLGPEGNIDFSAIEAVVDATHRYSEIFYSKEQ